ncbi:hypothetical protein GALL_133740 [mine drainage metagenome]|uniref:Uncharacterized protein n=1 Tax=mine drainage metagenome TaxID=410659 RepID=A0A1J5S928_9ZZZZ
MHDDTFNMNIRKFLKMVGVNSQHEIEKAVAQAIAGGNLKGNEKLAAKMTLSIGAANLNINFDGVIELE